MRDARVSRPWLGPAAVGPLLLAASVLLSVAGCGGGDPARRGHPSDQGAGSGTRAGEAAPSADPETRRALAKLLTDPDAGLGWTSFDSLARSVTSLRDCGGRSDGKCVIAVLLTDDRWASGVTLYLGPQTRLPWTQLLPDGSAAVVPDDPDRAVVLHPDGHTSHLTVFTVPAPARAGTVVTGGSGLPDADGRLFGRLWVLDPATASLAPLATQPPDGPAGPQPDQTGSGGLVVLQGRARHQSLATSDDDGRSWSTRALPDATDGTPVVLADVVAGPGRRLALRYTYDGATVAPWRDLWLSDDLGDTWRHVAARHHPDTVGGMGFAPDGTLLLTDDQQSRMWRVTSNGTDLEQAPGTPAAVTVRRTGGVLVAQVDQRTIAFSDDGTTWWTASPGRGFIVEENSGGTPIPVDGTTATSAKPEPCVEVRIRAGRVGAAAGSVVQQLTVRNLGREPCTLRGPLTVRFLGPDGTHLVDAGFLVDSNHVVSTVVLAPGQVAHALILAELAASYAPDDPVCRPVTTSLIELGLPGRPTQRRDPWAWTVCSSPAHRPLTTPVR